jgi:hypothetical protein
VALDIIGQTYGGRRITERALDGVTGARWFFAELVEPLCDSFDPALQDRVGRLLTEVIAECARRDPRLRARLDRVTVRPSHSRSARALIPAAAPDLCVIPSRVTVGADIAITAAITEVVRTAWPRTRIALAGAAGTLAPLARGRSGIEVWDHAYPRHGSVSDRLAVWLSVADAVDSWQRGQPGRSLLVLDPDSRMTQLGLLSLTRSARGTRLFASRSVPVGDRRCLTDLAVEWARLITGASGDLGTGPRLVPPSGAASWGRSMTAWLRARYGRPVVVCSLGVGGNQRKAASLDAEVATVMRVSRHATVILDAGATDEELRRARAVGRGWARRSGAGVAELPSGRPAPHAPDATTSLYLLRGADLDSVAGLLGHADLLVAYDSAFQHVAAAVGTPGVVVFVNPPSATFVDRWLAPGMTAIICDRDRAGIPANIAGIETEIITMLRAGGPRKPEPLARRTLPGMP